VTIVAGEPCEVAVIAGTPYDSELGARLLRAEGVAALPYATASSPDEQDSLQDQNPGALGTLFNDLLTDVRRKHVQLAMLFCNSLSSVVDHDNTVLPVVSPVTVYREVLPQLRSSLVVAGNAHALLGVERTARLTCDGRHRMFGVSEPMLVRGIEHGDPEEAFAASRLVGTLHRAQDLGLDAVILACTHFTAIKQMIAASCDMRVIDVGAILVDRTVSALRNGLLLQKVVEQD
jgi:glutamate racemase